MSAPKIDKSTVSITLAEVAAHNAAGNAWIVVDGAVLDVSKFANMHPGGKNILLKTAGTDASDQYAQFHGPHVMRKYKKKLLVGMLSTGGSKM
jgi:cytochrome b involved in lipid metabolism